MPTMEFICSSAKPSQCPETQDPEFAFLGRSNVGKSSLLNLLAGNKKLAKTSGTPGKTQLINHFKSSEGFYIADLPGYGYAKVSKVQRADFKKLIYGYLEQRSNLSCAMVLIDSRLPLQNADRDMLAWLGERGIPCAIVYTKADKSPKGALDKQLAQIRKSLLQDWTQLPPEFISSSVDRRGGEELWAWMREISQSLD